MMKRALLERNEVHKTIRERRGREAAENLGEFAHHNSQVATSAKTIGEMAECPTIRK